jgi:hypothetical protein
MKMEQAEKSFIEMSNGVLAHFDSETGLWQGTVLEGQVEGLRSGYVAVRGEALEATGIITTGITKTKDANLKKAIENTVKIINNLRGYARVTGDMKLFAEVDYTKTDLTHVSGELCESRCRSILDKARGQLSQMEGYGLSTELIDETETLLDTRSTLLAERELKNKDRKMANKDLDGRIDAMKGHFAVLDDLVPGMINDEVFVEKYFELRN